MRLLRFREEFHKKEGKGQSCRRGEDGSGRDNAIEIEKEEKAPRPESKARLVGPPQSHADDALRLDFARHVHSAALPVHHWKPPVRELARPALERAGMFGEAPAAK